MQNSLLSKSAEIQKGLDGHKQSQMQIVETMETATKQLKDMEKELANAISSKFSELEQQLNLLDENTIKGESEIKQELDICIEAKNFIKIKINELCDFVDNNINQISRQILDSSQV